MSSILDEAGSEGALLLYLAGELSAADRAEVEQRLQRDPALQAELERLSETEALLHERLASLDAATPLGGSEAAAVRNVSKVLRQRLARPLVAAPLAPLREGRRLPGWALTGAVAAAVAAVVVAVGMNTNRFRNNNNNDDDPVAVAPDDPDADPLAVMAGETWARYALVEPAGEPPPQVASVSYDQPLFDVPFSIPPEGGAPNP